MFHVEPVRRSVHKPVGLRTVVVPAQGVASRSPVPVTAVDRSTSCPQRCAQVGEISRRALTRGHDVPGETALAHTAVIRHHHGSDLRVHPVAAAQPPDVHAGRAPAWVRTGDGGWGNRGTGRGETAPHVQNRRDVHVSTQECARPPTVGQHVDFGTDLRGRPRSPGSTPVMTKMRDIDQGFSNHTLGGEAALRVT